MADPYKYESSYDLVNKYDWTSVPPNSPLRNEAPAAYVTAYQLQYSQLRSFIDGYLNVLGVNTPKGTKSATPGLDFYRRLYGTSSDPLARFSFPFFSDNIRSFSTEFADTFSPISQRGAQMLGGEFLQGLGGAGESVVGGAAALASGIANIGAAAENTGDKSVIDKVSKAAIQGTSNVFNKAFGTDINFNSGLQTIGAPGTYIETPKFYQYSNTDNGLELSFALSNTLNDYAREQNHKFIKDFTRMNRPFRTGPIGMTFPAIYNIVVPGQRYIMWAYLEDFSVGLLGNRRRVKLEGENGGSRIVPEAYTCQFNFRSLTIEAANFMDEIDKFGSFAGDEDSYSKLKAEEEKIMGDAKARADRAARERQRRNKIDRKPFTYTMSPQGYVSEDTQRLAAIADSFGDAQTTIINGVRMGSTTSSVSMAERREREAAQQAMQQRRMELQFPKDYGLPETDFSRQQSQLSLQNILNPGTVFTDRQGFYHPVPEGSTAREAKIAYERATGTNFPQNMEELREQADRNMNPNWRPESPTAFQQANRGQAIQETADKTPGLNAEDVSNIVNFLNQPGNKPVPGDGSDDGLE